MFAATLLAGLGLRGLGRVVQQPQRGGGVVQVAIEMVLGEVQRQRQPAHDGGAQRVRLLVIRLHHVAEIRQGGGPLVRAGIEAAGQHARVIGGNLGADIEALFQVGRRAGFQRLGAQRLIAPVAGREALVHGELVGHAQVEEALAGREHIADQHRVDAVVRQVEEAAMRAGIVQLRGHGAARGGVRAAQSGDVDQGQAKRGGGGGGGGSHGERRASKAGRRMQPSLEAPPCAG
ncbi:hypothetical protein D3C81_1275210 [compost metagenome]